MERKEIEESAKKLKRANSREDHVDDSIEETFDKYNSAKKEERIEQPRD